MIPMTPMEEVESYPVADMIKEIVVQLHKRPEMVKRIHRIVTPRGPTPLDSDDLAEIFEPLLAGLEYEHFAVAAFDNRHQLINTTILAKGSDRFVVVCRRQALRWALKQGARAIAIAHNHPSGDPTPSPQDHDVTDKMRAACKTVDLTFLDHIVVGDEGYRRAY